MTRLSILYVDDEPDIREIAAMALQLDPSFNVQTASSGLAALALLRDESWRADIILLDLMMPGLDGQALMSEIRRLERYAEVAIVFVTAKAAAADAQKLIANGAQGVITKPFDPMTFAQDVRRILAL